MCVCVCTCLHRWDVRLLSLTLLSSFPARTMRATTQRQYGMASRNFRNEVLRYIVSRFPNAATSGARNETEH